MALVLSLLANVAVLLVGALVLSVLYEAVAGNESFSLPFVNIIIVVLIGSVLFWWFGWRSTFIVLAVYGVFCIVGGLVER
jgi:hypothetical protein